MSYLSEQLMADIEKETGTKFKLCDKNKVRKVIRDYFIRVHNEACDATVMASNKKQFVKPNFDDKP